MTKATFKATWFGVFALCWVGFASPSVAQTQCIANVSAQGTSDAITSAQLPCGTTTNLVILTAAAANTTTAPTYAPVGSPALTIVRPNGLPLEAGDLQSGYVALLTSTGTSWVLLNPALGLPSSALTPGVTLVSPSTNGGVLFDNNGVLGDSKTLPSGLTIPIGSITGLGTGVGTALGTNVGSVGAPVVNGGALGTPSSGTATNLTGLPISTGVAGLGANVDCG